MSPSDEKRNLDMSAIPSVEEQKNMQAEINSRMGIKHKRPTWDEYFMLMADTISRRATCDRGRSGCVIAKNEQILVSGYVGSPVGFPHCDEAGHIIRMVSHEDGHQTKHCMRTVHAEQNAICQAAKLGIPIAGATLYTRMTPCRACAMLIIQCGIDRVVCEKVYHAGQDSINMFAEAGIEIVHLSDEIQKY